VSHSRTDPESVIALAPKRRAFQGVINTVRFNSEFYFVGLAALATGGILTWAPLPSWARFLGVSAVGIAAYFLMASLIASFWIYDLAPLYRWEWLSEFVGAQPRRALNLHAGFDETSLSLQRLFPTTAWWTADFFDPARHTEASIERARRACPTPTPFAKIKSTQLPYAAQTFDAIFLLFAAHEIRHAQEREQLFIELSRVLSSGGTIVLVEHVRNFANIGVYGPGAFHFYLQQEWERLVKLVGCTVTRIAPQTPFVVALKIQK
jgi:SAM-dependent methyltransferase